MERPTITVNEKTYEMPRPTGRTWRRLFEFDKNHNDIYAEDFIEKRCEFLAEIYGAKFTADDLLDTFDIAEITQAYRDCAGYILGRITAKFEEVEKNADKGGKISE